MPINMRQHVFLVAKADGTADPLKADGPIESVLRDLLIWMRQPGTRLESRREEKRLTVVMSNQPVDDFERPRELTPIEEIAAGLKPDLVVDDSALPHSDIPDDPLIRRLVQINYSRAAFESSHPDEQSELIAHARRHYPEWYANSFQKKHLA